MSRTCRILVFAFAILYGLALPLFFIGTFGLFGQEQDPLSGVFLIPLGLPWNLVLDGLPGAILPWATAAAPIVNLLILSAICRALSRRAG